MFLQDSFVPAQKTTMADVANPKDVVLVKSDSGVLREVDATVYNNMRVLGDEVYGVPKMSEELTANTAGRVAIEPPTAFPTSAQFPLNDLEKANSLTPLSSKARADFVENITSAASEVPKTVWEKLPQDPV